MDTPERSILVVYLPQGEAEHLTAAMTDAGAVRGDFTDLWTSLAAAPAKAPQRAGFPASATDGQLATA
jgi:hypothetical protein